MVRRETWRPIRNAFHYECDLVDNATPFSGSFDLNYCTDYNLATATDGRLILTGDGNTYPYAILPLPERAKDRPHSRANGNIFTAQAHLSWAASPVDQEEVVQANEAVRMYILDEFMDRNNPIGFIQVTALAVAAGEQYGTVQCEGRRNGAWNVDTYGGNFQIWGATALYTPVTIELRLDMRVPGRYRLNYTLAHCLGAPSAWDTVEDDMFELMSVGELDCDDRRPAYVMFELLNDAGDPPEHDLSVPDNGDLICIHGIHFAEDPIIMIGNNGGNLITQGFGLAGPVQAYPHRIGQHNPQPIISHSINQSCFLSDAGVGDAISGRYADMTYNQGYRKLMLAPLIEYDDDLGGAYETWIEASLKPAYLAMLNAIYAAGVRYCFVCGVLPAGDLAHPGVARTANKRRCFTGFNRWLKRIVKGMGYDFIDVHDLLNYEKSENTVNYDYYGFTPPATVWSSTGAFPDAPAGFSRLAAEVCNHLDRSRRKSVRYNP